MYNFEALNNDDRNQMLKDIGVKSVEEIFNIIPSDVRLKEFNLEEGKSELHAQKALKKLSLMNKTDYLCFLGGGARKRYIPPIIADISSRFEFLSCYTPYQAEISQGTLEAMYEFQSLMCTLTNQDISNASVYDGATAAAEAILASSRITKNNKVYLDKNINPNYLKVIKTYLWAEGIEIAPENYQGDDLCAKVYQTPNYRGELVDIPEKNSKELIIALVDLMALVLFEPPKADFTVGDIQSFGTGLNFGGAYGGFIASGDIYKRQLPGRICGKTTDREGKTAYCLTLQAREQHIRRQKATSNICSNQALVAFCANLYLRKLGKKGLIEIAQKSYDNAHKLAEGLDNIGFKINNREFFDEFSVNVGYSDGFLNFMKDKGILAGIKLDNSSILVSVSELNDKDEIDEYIKSAKSLSLIKI